MLIWRRMPYRPRPLNTAGQQKGSVNRNDRLVDDPGPAGQVAHTPAVGGVLRCGSHERHVELGPLGHAVLHGLDSYAADNVGEAFGEGKIATWQ